MNAKTITASSTDTAQSKTPAKATQGFDQTIAGLKNSINAADSGFQQAQASMQQGMGKAMRTAEEVIAFGQGNLEAAMKSSQILMAGMQDLGRQAAATAQTQIEENLSLFRALTGAKSFRDALDIQSNLGRSSVEKAFSESGKLAEASFKLVEQAWAPLTQRVSQAMERFSVPA